jgi:ribosomal protein S27E
MIKCKDCKSAGKVVMHAMDTTECEICQKQIITAHTPGDKICVMCSIENKKCIECAKDLNDD